MGSFSTLSRFNSNSFESKQIEGMVVVYSYKTLVEFLIGFIILIDVIKL